MKKKLLIILIAVVVLVAAGITAYMLFSPKSLSGDWEMVVNPELSKATPDEADSAEKTYYSFSQPGEYGDGEYKTIYDGGVEKGEYKLSEKNGKKYINMGTDDLEYRIEGSTLTITYPAHTDEQTGKKVSAQDYVFNSAKAPDYENESYESYHTDAFLLSEWETKDRTLDYYANKLSYTETVKFDGNGVMTIHYESKDLALDRYMYYAYSADNNKLTFSLVTDKDKKNTVSYKASKNGNLKFTDDKTASSIFSDAVFSDAVYKKKK